MITGPTILKFFYLMSRSLPLVTFSFMSLAHRPFTRVILPDLLHIEPLLPPTTAHPDSLFTKSPIKSIDIGEIHVTFSLHQHVLKTTSFCADSEFHYLSSVLSWGHSPTSTPRPHLQDTGPSKFCSILSATPSVYKHTQDVSSLKRSFLTPASSSNTCLFSLTPEVFRRSIQ